jgi:hypothetical protein
MGILIDTMKIADLLDKYKSKEELVEIIIPYSSLVHSDIQSELFRNINSEKIQYSESKDGYRSIKVNGIIVHLKKEI